jgi:4-amino-4-deoxy-L-arabinose transferase-like glycosyltransferase
MLSSGTRIPETPRVSFLTPASFLIRCGDRLNLFLRQREKLAVAIPLCVFLLWAIWASAQSALWFDEIFSYSISQQPTVRDALNAMPADGQLPLHYALIRLSTWLVGHTELAARLYSVLAYAVAAIAVYRIVRRRAEPAYACFGMMSFLTGGTMMYAHSARPYSLMLCFTALAFLAWQAARESPPPRLAPLLALAAAVGGAVSSHLYGVVQIVLPLGVGEIVRWFRTRRFDWPVYSAVGAGCLFLLPDLSIARGARIVMGDAVAASTRFWSRPGLNNLFDYRDLVSPAAFWMFLALAVLMYPDLRRRTQATPPDAPATGWPVTSWPAEEVGAVVALALLLPCQIAVTSLTTRYFLPRYAIGTGLGAALLCGLLPSIVKWGSKRFVPVAVVTSFCLLALLLAHLSSRIVTSFHLPPRISPVLFRDTSELPIVVDSALDYAPDCWYSPPNLRSRLAYLSDRPYAIRQPDFLPEISLTADRPYIPMKVTPYGDFVNRHARFLLLAGSYPRLEWTRDRLLSSGWRSTLVTQDPNSRLYLMEAPAEPGLPEK